MPRGRGAQRTGTLVPRHRRDERQQLHAHAGPPDELRLAVDHGLQDRSEVRLRGGGDFFRIFVVERPRGFVDVESEFY